MPFGRTAWWGGQTSDEAPTSSYARDVAIVRHGFWKKVRRVAASIPFLEELLTAYYCAFDRETPLQVKAALVAALAYFVLPADMMPDILPLLGFGDDAAVLAGAMKLVLSHVRPEHRELAQRTMERFSSEPA
jgi:uncharacterized membrane protein YkvA (DUF1232 family)